MDTYRYEPSDFRTATRVYKQINFSQKRARGLCAMGS